MNLPDATTCLKSPQSLFPQGTTAILKCDQQMAVLFQELVSRRRRGRRCLCKFCAKSSQILTSSLFLSRVILLGFVVTSVQSPQNGGRNRKTAAENVYRGAPGEFGGQAPSPSSLLAGAAEPREPGKRLCHPRPQEFSRKSLERRLDGSGFCLANALSPSEFPPTWVGRPPGPRWVGGRDALASLALPNLFARHCHPS